DQFTSQLLPQADSRDHLFERLGNGLPLDLVASSQAPANVETGASPIEARPTRQTLARSGDRAETGTGKSQAGDRNPEAGDNGGVAGGIDWFLVAAAVTAIALPPQSGEREHTERLFAAWIKEQNEAAR